MGKKIYLIGKLTIMGPLYMGYTDDKNIAKSFKNKRKGFEVIKINKDDVPEEALTGEEILEYPVNNFKDMNYIFESEEEVLVSNYYETLYEIPSLIDEFKEVLSYVKFDKRKAYALLDELNYIYDSLRYDDMNGDLEDYISIDKFADFYIKEILDE